MTDPHHVTTPVVGWLLYRTLQLSAKVAGASVEELLRWLAIRESKQREAERKRKLTMALGRLSARSPESDEADVVAFARAEVTVDDPLRAVRVDPGDAHGVGAAFARRLE